MDDATYKTRENFSRRWAKRLGLFLQKSRAKLPSIDNLGGYRLIDTNDTIIDGEKFDLDLDQVEVILAEQEKDLPQLNKKRS